MKEVQHATASTWPFRHHPEWSLRAVAVHKTAELLAVANGLRAGRDYSRP